MAAGGGVAEPVAGCTLAATGRTARGPRTGVSCCTCPWPKRSAGTPTTALVTFTLRYTVMLVTLMFVVRLTTTLLTTRGPPQPPHHATPTKPGCPHHGITG